MHKVLVIDDDVSVADSLSEILRRGGYEVTTVYEFDAAIKALSNEVEYAVVISDLRLGEADGSELLCFLREQAPCTITILFSAYPSRAAVLKARYCAAYYFLVKPCDPDRLIRTVSSAAALHQDWITLRDENYLES